MITIAMEAFKVLFIDFTVFSFMLFSALSTNWFVSIPATPAYMPKCLTHITFNNLGFGYENINNIDLIINLAFGFYCFFERVLIFENNFNCASKFFIFPKKFNVGLREMFFDLINYIVFIAF